jgi:PAS domain S-box-containing protein
MSVESTPDRVDRAEALDAPLQTIVDSMRDCAIVMLDREGRIQTWNAGATRLDGYLADEIVGRPLAALHAAAAVSEGRDRRLLGEAARTGSADGEGWRVRKDGTTYWASESLSAVMSEGGAPIGYAMLTRDLSERRHREEQVRRSDERFRLVIEGIRDYAIFMLDAHGRVATWNAGAERIKGYRAEEIIGQHFSRFYDPAEVRAGKCELELEVAGRDGRFEDEGWRLRKDGTAFWANVVLTALRDGDGTLVGFAKVTRDLTERRIAEQERTRLERAQEAVRLRDEFLTIASHELRTPLAALLLQLDSLAELAPGLDAKVARRIDRARQGGERLTQLVDSLLDVSRLSTVGLALSTASVDLGALAGQHVAVLSASAAAVDSELVLRVAGPVIGVWDPVRIGQVVTNLVANAIKYGAGHPIIVQVWSAAGEAILEVRDHGPCVAAADLPRIFERFERAAPLRNYGGLGLGLYVTREIVVAHGGTVVAENATDGGARFIVRLPLVGPTREP